MNEMLQQIDTRVLARRNVTPVLSLLAGPALMWAGFSHSGPTKVRAALGVLGAALTVAAYPQLRHEVDRLFK